MSRDDRDNSIWTTDISPYRDGKYMLRRNPLNGRMRVHKVNADRDLKTTLIVGLLFIAFLIFTLGRASKPPEIRRSTKAREKISSSVSAPAQYIYDPGGLIDDTVQATSAMNSFYNKTGVAPFLYIYKDESDNAVLDDAALDEFAKKQYQSLFNDDAHLFILFYDRGGNKCSCYMYAGSEALKFMDTEAQQILSDCILHYTYIEREKVRYRDDVLHIDKAIADAFNDAGSRLMRVDIDPLVYVTVGVGAVFVLTLIILTVKRRYKRRGKLIIEKEYLPGEYIPASVMRTSDTENAARGIKYRYGSEGVSGDLPNGIFCTPEMLHPEMPSAEMPSVEIPKGVLLEPGMLGGSSAGGVNTPYHGTIQYRDNRGNLVLQKPDDNKDNSFEKWAEAYRLGNADSAFGDEGEYFGASTTTYTDNRGISHLINNDKNEEQ